MASIRSPARTKREILLVHVGLDPHGGKIGDLEERHAHRDAAALDHRFDDYLSGLRRADQRARGGRARGRHRVDVAVADAKQPQPLAGGRGQVGCAAGPKRQQILLACIVQLGAIQLGQWIALLYVVERLIDV